LQILEFYWRSPKSSDVWYKSRQLKGAICSDREWDGRKSGGQPRVERPRWLDHHLRTKVYEP